jgi:RNA polymerase sigma-70 factor (ECF subfamily)
MQTLSGVGHDSCGRLLIVAAPTSETREAVEISATSAELTFDLVYQEYFDFVWRSTRRLGVTEEAVDDVVQNVFVVVHRRLAEYASGGSLRSWLFSIVLRIVQNHRRSVHRKSPHWRQGGGLADPDTLPHDGAHPFRALSRAEAACIIEKLLESLDEDKRAIFVLAELEQMTAPEIAQVTGLQPKEIYSLLRSARTDFERAAAVFRRENATRPT